MGFFTEALIEGLQGAASVVMDGVAVVTLSKLNEYIGKVVPNRVKTSQGENAEQKPYCKIDGYLATKLVLAVAGTNNVPRDAKSPVIDAVVEPRTVGGHV